MATRTKREFPVTGNFWTIVDEWARENNFESVPTGESSRLYRRGRDYFDFPVLIEIHAAHGHARLEAWIKASALDRGRALFLIPAEMGLESGGAQMMVARTNGRKSLNLLLARLGQPPIV